MKDNLRELDEQRESLLKQFGKTDSWILYQQVGLALTAWAKLEDSLVLMFAMVLRLDPSKAGLILFSVINFNVWLTLLHDLLEMDEALSGYQKQWNKISESIRAIKDQRDQLAHHSVQELRDDFDSAALQASQFDSRRKSKLQRPMTIDEVIAFTEDVIAICDRLSNLYREMLDALHVFHEKSGD